MAKYPTVSSARLYDGRCGRVAKKLAKVIESEVTASEDNGNGNHIETNA